MSNLRTGAGSGTDWVFNNHFFCLFSNPISLQQPSHNSISLSEPHVCAGAVSLILNGKCHLSSCQFSCGQGPSDPLERQKLPWRLHCQLHRHHQPVLVGWAQVRMTASETQGRSVLLDSNGFPCSEGEKIVTFKKQVDLNEWLKLQGRAKKSLALMSIDYREEAG